MRSKRGREKEVIDRREYFMIFLRKKETLVELCYF